MKKTFQTLIVIGFILAGVWLLLHEYFNRLDYNKMLPSSVLGDEDYPYRSRHVNQ